MAWRVDLVFHLTFSSICDCDCDCDCMIPMMSVIMSNDLELS